jgi:hypothetical protein
MLGDDNNDDDSWADAIVESMKQVKDASDSEVDENEPENDFLEDAEDSASEGEYEDEFLNSIRETNCTKSELEGDIPTESDLLHNLPTGASLRLSKAMEKLILFTTDYYYWIPTFQVDGVMGWKKSGPGMLTVRGRSVFPFTIPEIFAVLSRPSKRSQFDHQITKFKIKPLSTYSAIEYLRYKAVWPTAPRDFCNLMHWRVLPDGTFLYFAFSEKFGEFPEVKGAVRANLVVGGYVMRHAPGGTDVHFAMQVIP